MSIARYLYNPFRRHDTILDITNEGTRNMASPSWKYFFVVILGDSPAIEWTTVFTALAFAGLIVVNTIASFRKGTK